MLKTRIMKCHRCGYEWPTKSKLRFLTCPNCQTKTKKVKEGAQNES